MFIGLNEPLLLKIDVICFCIRYKNMSDIIDFKILSTDLYGTCKYNFNIIPAFVESINSYLNKGYTFHGSTKFNGAYSVTQVLVKYKNQATKPTIDEYKLICFAVAGSGSATVGAGPVVQFEKDIIDELNNGWSLYFDTEIYRITDPHRCEVHLMQGLVKYKKPEINLLDI